MSTKSATLDHEVGYTTEEIERYHDHQDRSARRRRWLLGAGAAVAVTGGITAAALMFTSSGSTPAAPAAPTVTSTSTANPAVPSRPNTPVVNPAVPSRPVVNPAVPSHPGTINPAVPASPAQGTGTSAG
jgi:type IV secretory pathway VirB10-like protein